MEDYHTRTKHSYASIRNNPNYLDWEKQPPVFKNYEDFLSMIKLDDSLALHRLIYRIGGITAKKVYPSTAYYLRTVPSAGALYPVEFYFQCRDVEGFDDGIYHFDVKNSAVKLLHRIEEQEGVEVYFEDRRKIKGFLFLLSTIYYRSSWKYRDRAFRYCLLDAGHGLGTLEASMYLEEMACNIRYRFDKETLNKQFGFGDKEFFLSCVVAGAPKSERAEFLALNLEDANPKIERNLLIEEAYHHSCKVQNCKTNKRFESFNYDKKRFEEVIYQRRSIREFTKQSISKASFEVILENINKSIISDCDEQVNIYYVVNRVRDMQKGLYLGNKLLKDGDFSIKAGYLCLEQALGRDSAVTFFLTTNSLNYQCAYQKAGYIGQRLYLSCEYLHIGCSGIGAYYDDEVLAFLDCPEEKVLYALAIGT